VASPDGRDHAPRRWARRSATRTSDAEPRAASPAAGGTHEQVPARTVRGQRNQAQIKSCQDGQEPHTPAAGPHTREPRPTLGVVRPRPQSRAVVRFDGEDYRPRSTAIALPLEFVHDVPPQRSVGSRRVVAERDRMSAAVRRNGRTAHETSGPNDRRQASVFRVATPSLSGVGQHRRGYPGCS